MISKLACPEFRYCFAIGESNTFLRKIAASFEPISIPGMELEFLLLTEVYCVIRALRNHQAALPR